MNNEIRSCCVWRRRLQVAGAASWAISLAADAAAFAGWGGVVAKWVAWYGIVAGIVAVVIAAFACGYNLQFQREDRAGNAELLDGGVLLAAALLFAVNAAWRLNSPLSPLPPLLSLLGLGAVLWELYVDDEEVGATLSRGDGRKAVHT